MLTLLNLKFSCCSHVNHKIFIRVLSTSQLKEYYALLKVQKSSSPKEIKESFLRLSKVYHPDNKTTGSHLRFVKLKEAYDAIKDGPPATSDHTSSSTANNRYSNYDPFADLSHKAHAYYRERHRDYPPKYTSYGRSETPWEDFKRDKEYERARRSYSNIYKGKPEPPNVLAIVLMITFMVFWIGSGLLRNADDHRHYESARKRREEYVAYREYLRKKEADPSYSPRNHRTIRDRMSTRIDTGSEPVDKPKINPVTQPESESGVDLTKQSDTVPSY